MPPALAAAAAGGGGGGELMVRRVAALEGDVLVAEDGEGEVEEARVVPEVRGVCEGRGG